MKIPIRLMFASVFIILTIFSINTVFAEDVSNKEYHEKNQTTSEQEKIPHNNRVKSKTQHQTPLSEGSPGDNKDTKASKAINNAVIPLIAKVHLSPELENKLEQFIDTSNNYFKSKSNEKQFWDKLLSILARFAAVMGSIIGFFITYKSLKDTTFWHQNRELILTVFSLIIFMAVVFFLGGFISSVLDLVLKLLLLLILGCFVAVYSIQTLLNHYPQYKLKFSQWIETSEKKTMATLHRITFKELEQYFTEIAEYQKAEGIIELSLDGSFADGYNNTIFTIIPKKSETSYWKVIDGEILVPVNIDIKLVTNAGEKHILINLQRSCAVVCTESDKLKYVTLSDSAKLKLKDKLFEFKAAHFEKR